MKIIKIDEPGDAKWARENELICLSNYKELTLTYHRDEDDTYWLIKCCKVAAYKSTGEEFSMAGYLSSMPFEGSFFEILDSPWIKELDNGKKLNKYKHCVYYFYDHTIEIIAQEYLYAQLKQKPIMKYQWEILKKDIN